MLPYYVRGRPEAAIENMQRRIELEARSKRNARGWPSLEHTIVETITRELEFDTLEQTRLVLKQFFQTHPSNVKPPGLSTMMARMSLLDPSREPCSRNPASGWI